MSWNRLRRDLRSLEGTPEDGMPRRIGKHDVVRELCRTNSSQLYLGRDPQLGRPVAIKVLREDRGDAEFIRRFQREGAIAAGLRHPNIITVHEVGLWLDDGMRETPYLVMDYVDGGTLAGRRMDVRAAAETMATVADAVAHAHAQGVIHRDLKPGNILIDGAGRPIVTDFGLAKKLRGDSVATLEGSILGTPQYMAPEQVRGDAGKADGRTDVYALGAILYELTAGTPPYSDPNLASLFDRILRGDAPPPSARRPDLPRALEAVILKAMQKDPGDRYESAAGLAADLRAFLAGGRVAARPPSTVRRMFRSRRSAAGWAAGALVALGLIAWALRTTGEGGGTPPDLPIPEGPPAASAWAELGGSASEGGISRMALDSFQEDLAVGPDNHPIVAWRDLGEGGDDVFLRRWTGTEWAPLGGSASGGGVSRTPGHSLFPVLALDARGAPTVAWTDQGAGVYNVFVRRWTGAGWTELGGSAAGKGISRADLASGALDLALDDRGNPTVVWQQTVAQNRSQIWLRRWDGSSWIELGGSGSGAGISRMDTKCALPALALDRANRPVVAWIAMIGDHWETACARWSGTAWEPYGSLLLGGHSIGPAWLEHRCALALDLEDRPIVAWADASPLGYAMFLKKWDGTAWVELDGSATGQGVSRGTGGTAAVALAVDGKGNPVVTWAGNGAGAGNIYLRWWDGSRWRELGGSATGGGISRTPAMSGSPRVRLDREGNPVVAWTESCADGVEVYLRRFGEFAPAGLRRVGGRLQAVVRTAVTGSKARLEVEAQDPGKPFTGAAPSVSPWSDPGTRVEVAIPKAQRWRARTRNDLGLPSAWVESP